MSKTGSGERGEGETGIGEPELGRHHRNFRKRIRILAIPKRNFVQAPQDICVTPEIVRRSDSAIECGLR